jgi:glycosyltransferase involved in cell wall biosynthesis
MWLLSRQGYIVQILRRLYYSIVSGKLQFIEPLYALAIGLELAFFRIIDLIQSKDDAQISVNNDLTALIKTFERPTLLNRLIASIKRKYPNVHIIIVDDSQSPSRIGGVETIIMPYDSGVSAGRNEGLKHVKTKYVLMLDDDFIFYRKTNLGAALAFMEKFPQIDIMGGEVVYLPLFYGIDYSKGTQLHPTKAVATLPVGSYIGDFPVYDRVPNFYIGRTDRAKLVGWDSNIKRLDHTDFFTRAKGVLTSVLNSDLKCLHAQNPFDKRYMEKRNDVAKDRIILNAKYYYDE